MIKTDDQSSVVSAHDPSSIIPVQKIEAMLNAADFNKIMAVFISDSNQNQLTSEEFVEKLSLTLKKGAKRDFKELFEKIDVAKEGLIDWNKFVDHMLLEFYEEDEKVKDIQVPKWKALKQVYSPHKEAILTVQLQKSASRYITVSKEAVIGFWDLRMKMIKTCKLSFASIKQKDLWVTSCALLTNLNKLAVTFTNKEIVIYDLSSKPEFNCQYRVQGLPNTPISMSYWYNKYNPNHANLSIGDIKGTVRSIMFYSALSGLFPRPMPGGKEAAKHSDEVTTYTNVKDIPCEMTKRTKHRIVYHNQHKGWVRQVSYLDNLECFVSCSTEKHSSLIMGYPDKERAEMRTVRLKYDSGVNCFAYHKRMNLIISGSINHQVCLWNPYVVTKPVGLLVGHMAPIVQIAINKEDKNQAISFSKDKAMRIWDLQQQSCVQRITGIFPKGPEVETMMMFDNYMNRLFITFNNQITSMDLKLEIYDQILSHERPITSIIYNKKYNQVISSSEDGVVTVWSVDSGHKIKQFVDCHGNNELTTMLLQKDGSRLLTGGSEGVVKVWDLNGHCHNCLNCGNNSNITQILSLKRSIIVVGWSKIITSFKKSFLKNYHVDPSDWLGGSQHKDDILCADFHPPSLLVTGSHDGEIVVWNYNSEIAMSKMHCEDSPKDGLESVSRDSRPNSSADKKTDVELSIVTSHLKLLSHRLESNSSGVNLISCGGGGFLRMWNVKQAKFVHQVSCHPHASHVTFDVDELNNVLVTGDSNGVIKSWSLENYMLTDKSIKENLPAIESWKAHLDSVNSLQVFDNNDSKLVISASSDCCVSLWDLYGRKIGDFGQEKPWKLADIMMQFTKQQQSLNEKEHLQPVEEEKKNEVTEPVEDKQVGKSFQNIDDDDSYETWKSTSLGKFYKEQRTNKRARKQPEKIFGFGRYLESTSTPYGNLKCSVLDVESDFKKPDFIENPQRYFSEKLYSSDEDKNLSKSLQETSIRDARQALKAAFDEKSFFPKEMLDFEAQMRSNHEQKLKLLSEKQKDKTQNVILKVVDHGSRKLSTSTSFSFKPGC